MRKIIKTKLNGNAIAKMQAIILVAIVAVAVIAGGVYFAYFSSPQSESGNIRIGVLLPLTGSMAQSGQETKRGYDFAREMINEAGGVLGRKIDYVYGDAVDTTAAVGEAERLITVENVPIILGTFSSSLAFAASEVAERNKRIYWETNAVAVNIAERGFKYFFRTTCTSAQMGLSAADFIIDMGAAKIGKDVSQLTAVMCHEQGVYGSSMATAVTAEFAKAGIDILSTDAYDPKSVDLSPIITKYKGLNADIFMAWCASVADSQLIYQQIKELNYWAPIVICHQSNSYAWQAFFQKDGWGVCEVAPGEVFNKDGLIPSVKSLLDDLTVRYKARYNITIETKARLGFSGAWTLFDVIKKAGSTDPDTIREVALSYDEPAGSTITAWGVKFAGPDSLTPGNNVNAFYLVNQFQNGSMVTIYPPAFAMAQPQLPFIKWEDRT